MINLINTKLKENTLCRQIWFINFIWFAFDAQDSQFFTSQ